MSRITKTPWAVRLQERLFRHRPAHEGTRVRGEMDDHIRNLQGKENELVGSERQTW